MVFDCLERSKKRRKECELSLSPEAKLLQYQRRRCVHATRKQFPKPCSSKRRRTGCRVVRRVS